MGIQSFSNNIREKFFNRYTLDSQIDNAFNILNEENIHCVADHILGLSDLKTELLQMVNFYKNKKMVFVLPNWIINYPALEINTIMKKNNFLINRDFEHGVVNCDKNIQKHGKEVKCLYNLLLLCHLLPEKLINFFIARNKTRIIFSIINTRILHFLSFNIYFPKEIRSNSVIKRYTSSILNKFLYKDA